MNTTPFFSYYMLVIRKLNFLLLLGLLTIASCNEDTPKESTDVFANKYKFVSATMVEDVPGYDNLTKGADASRIIRTGLFSVHSCTNASNGALELRSDKTLYFFCIDEDSELQGGTWSGNSDNTKLTFNLANPPFPQAISIEIAKVQITETSLTGTISDLPIPTWIIENKTAPDDPLDLANPANIPVQLTVDLTFQKIK